MSFTIEQGPLYDYVIFAGGYTSRLTELMLGKVESDHESYELDRRDPEVGSCKLEEEICSHPR